MPQLERDFLLVQKEFYNNLKFEFLQTSELDYTKKNTLQVLNDNTIWYVRDENTAIKITSNSLNVVNNYSELPDPVLNNGKFFWVKNSQGTRWLPGSLGGTYYPKGVYYSNSVAWEHIETPYQATQQEVNLGQVNDKFVSPETLANYPKFSKEGVGLGNVENIDTTNPENINQDSSHRFVTDFEKQVWNEKQERLIDGLNIKTINNIPILGPGNINISNAPGGESVWVNTNNPIFTVGGFNNSEPATDNDGITFQEFANKLLFPPVAPIINSFTSNTTSLPYKQSNSTVIVNWNYSIGTVGGTLQRILLEVSRNGGTNWTVLNDSSTHFTSFTHTNIPFGGNLIYRISITNSSNLTSTSQITVAYQTFVAPTISFTLSREGEREKGDMSTTISGSITRNSVNVNLVSYSIQFRLNNGTWQTLNNVNISGGSAVITNFIHNDLSLALPNTNTIDYRVIVVNDGESNTFSSTRTVTFRYRSYFGFNTNGTLNSASVIGLGNSIFDTDRARNVTGVTATNGAFTYYAYPASFGDLTSIIMDGAAPILGAFNKTTLNVTNNFNVTEQYNIYRSNATNAFSNNNLNFS